MTFTTFILLYLVGLALTLTLMVMGYFRTKRASDTYLKSQGGSVVMIPVLILLGSLFWPVIMIAWAEQWRRRRGTKPFQR